MADNVAPMDPILIETEDEGENDGEDDSEVAMEE
jgi:hypothetical protein